MASMDLLERPSPSNSATSASSLSFRVKRSSSASTASSASSSSTSSAASTPRQCKGTLGRSSVKWAGGEDFSSTSDLICEELGKKSAVFLPPTNTTPATIAATKLRSRQHLRRSSTTPAFRREPTSWETPKWRILPDLIETCRCALQQKCDKFPQDEAEVRQLIGKQPSSSLELRLQRGEPLAKVRQTVALQVVEKWVRLLGKKVPESDLPSCISRMVHNEDVIGGHGKLGEAILRLVPRPAEVELLGFTYISDLLAVHSLEGQLDRKSVMHAPAQSKLPSRQRLAIACGGEPPIWELPGSPDSSPWARNLSGSGAHGFARSSSLLGRDRQDAMYQPRPWGGDLPSLSHAKLQKYSGLNSSSRGHFPPVGARRPVCLATSMSHGSLGVR